MPCSQLVALALVSLVSLALQSLVSPALFSRAQRVFVSLVPQTGGTGVRLVSKTVITQTENDFSLQCIYHSITEGESAAGTIQSQRI